MFAAGCLVMDQKLVPSIVLLIVLLIVLRIPSSSVSSCRGCIACFRRMNRNYKPDSVKFL